MGVFTLMAAAVQVVESAYGEGPATLEFLLEDRLARSDPSALVLKKVVIALKVMKAKEVSISKPQSSASPRSTSSKLVPEAAKEKEQERREARADIGCGKMPCEGPKPASKKQVSMRV